MLLKFVLNTNQSVCHHVICHQILTSFTHVLVHVIIWHVIFHHSCKNMRDVAYNSVQHSFMYSVLFYDLFVCLMVFSVTFNNISVISWRLVLLVEDPEKTTDLSQVTDKLYLIMYTSPWSRLKLTTSVVIGTDCLGIRNPTTIWSQPRRPQLCYDKVAYCWLINFFCRTGMAVKRGHIDLDPDYEDVSEQQTKRQRVLEEDGSFNFFCPDTIFNFQ